MQQRLLYPNTFARPRCLGQDAPECPELEVDDSVLLGRPPLLLASRVPSDRCCVRIVGFS
jgi:hypothetical protein